MTLEEMKLNFYMQMTQKCILDRAMGDLFEKDEYFDAASLQILLDVRVPREKRLELSNKIAEIEWDYHEAVGDIAEGHNKESHLKKQRERGMNLIEGVDQELKDIHEELKILFKESRNETQGQDPTSVRG